MPRVKIHAAPTLPLSFGPPIRAVVPSSESATVVPKCPLPDSSFAVSFEPICDHVEPERMKAHAAPGPLPSARPPMRAVLPSSESATESPKNRNAAVPPVPVNFEPCCVHAPLTSLYAYAEPVLLMPVKSLCAPISAVLPSPESATAAPYCAPDWPPPVNMLSCVTEATG